MRFKNLEKAQHVYEWSFEKPSLVNVFYKSEYFISFHEYIHTYVQTFIEYFRVIRGSDIFFVLRTFFRI